MYCTLKMLECRPMRVDALTVRVRVGLYRPKRTRYDGTARDIVPELGSKGTVFGCCDVGLALFGPD